MLDVVDTRKDSAVQHSSSNMLLRGYACASNGRGTWSCCPID
jgi:hypothetical protein